MTAVSNPNEIKLNRDVFTKSYIDSMKRTTASRSAFDNFLKFSTVFLASEAGAPCHIIASNVFLARQSCNLSLCPEHMAESPRPHRGVVRHQPVLMSLIISKRCCTISVYGHIF